MKQLYGKLWVKCTAIALLVVFAILLPHLHLVPHIFFTYGAYADGGEQVRQIAEKRDPPADERRRLDGAARLGRRRQDHARPAPRAL